MDENTIKVLARFTEIGQDWPMYSWFYSLKSDGGTDNWIYVACKVLQKRLPNELSELEANQKGVFRNG